MGKKTKNIDQFKAYANAWIKPKEEETDHEKAVERIKKLSTPIKKKVKFKKKF